MNKTRHLTLGIAILLSASCNKPFASDETLGYQGANQERFKELDQSEWKEVFHDPGTGNWKDNWMLDGRKATIRNTQEGMDFAAGSVFGDDAYHAVMWTKQTFSGDLRIDYEYTKLDEQTSAVTIIYIQATGSGIDPYKTDIAEWDDLRTVPSMGMYFRNMNTYHISYASFGFNNSDPMKDYIRARRYMPKSRRLKGTELKPDYFETGLFTPGRPYKITIIKKENDLFMHIVGKEKEMLCHWKTDSFPPVIKGRIGLRHMYTRSARYHAFRVSVLNSLQEDVEQKDSNQNHILSATASS